MYECGYDSRGWQNTQTHRTMQMLTQTHALVHTYCMRHTGTCTGVLTHIHRLMHNQMHTHLQDIMSVMHETSAAIHTHNHSHPHTHTHPPTHSCSHSHHFIVMHETNNVPDTHHLKCREQIGHTWKNHPWSLQQETCSQINKHTQTPQHPKATQDRTL